MFVYLVPRKVHGIEQVVGNYLWRKEEGRERRKEGRKEGGRQAGRQGGK